MAEIEVHTGHHGAEDDPVGRRVGFLVGVIGIVLAVVTIAAHRQHTAAVIFRTEANDQWSYCQAKKIREHVSSVGADIVSVLDAAKAAAAHELFDKQRAKYSADAEEIKTKAETQDKKTEHAEALALRFDLGEGFLELGLVLSSLYFLGRRLMFPIAGGFAAVVGVATALSALLA